MANNPYVNKVEYGGTTLIDITDTTATEDKVQAGYYFYKANGQKVMGTASGGGGSVQIDTATLATSATTQTVTASGTNVCNVQVVDSVTHEQVITDVNINGNSVTVTVAAAPTNTLNITVMSY